MSSRWCLENRQGSVSRQRSKDTAYPPQRAPLDTVYPLREHLNVRNFFFFLSRQSLADKRIASRDGCVLLTVVHKRIVGCKPTCRKGVLAQSSCCRACAPPTACSQRRALQQRSEAGLHGPSSGCLLRVRAGLSSEQGGVQPRWLSSRERYKLDNVVNKIQQTTRDPPNESSRSQQRSVTYPPALSDCSEAQQNKCFGSFFWRSDFHPHPQSSLLRIFRLQPGLE